MSTTNYYFTSCIYLRLRQAVTEQQLKDSASEHLRRLSLSKPSAIPIAEAGITIYAALGTEEVISISYPPNSKDLFAKL